MNSLNGFAVLAGRLLVAQIFLISGYGKITGYAGTQGYMESMGVPGMLLPLVIAVEIVGGLALVVGWRTRLAALALAGFTLVAALLFHTNFTEQAQVIQFQKNLAVTGGLLFLFAHGGGPWSLDARRGAA